MNHDNQLLPNGKLNTSLTDFDFNFESMEIMHDLIHQFINYNPYPNLEMEFSTDAGGDNTGCFYTVIKQFKENTESHFMGFIFEYQHGVKDFLHYINVIRPRHIAIDEILSDLD